MLKKKLRKAVTELLQMKIETGKNRLKRRKEMFKIPVVSMTLLKH